MKLYENPHIYRYELCVGHFPTGYANGALKDAEPELCRQFVYYSSVVVTGPMKSAQLDISKHAKYVDNHKGNKKA